METTTEVTYDARSLDTTLAVFKGLSATRELDAISATDTWLEGYNKGLATAYHLAAAYIEEARKEVK